MKINKKTDKNQTKKFCKNMCNMSDKPNSKHSDICTQITSISKVNPVAFSQQQLIDCKP